MENFDQFNLIINQMDKICHLLFIFRIFEDYIAIVAIKITEEMAFFSIYDKFLLFLVIFAYSSVPLHIKFVIKITILTFPI